MKRMFAIFLIFCLVGAHGQAGQETTIDRADIIQKTMDNIRPQKSGSGTSQTIRARIQALGTEVLSPSYKVRCAKAANIVLSSSLPLTRTNMDLDEMRIEIYFLGIDSDIKAIAGRNDISSETERLVRQNIEDLARNMNTIMRQYMKPYYTDRELADFVERTKMAARKRIADLRIPEFKIPASEDSLTSLTSDFRRRLALSVPRMQQRLAPGEGKKTISEKRMVLSEVVMAGFNMLGHATRDDSLKSVEASRRNPKKMDLERKYMRLQSSTAITR